MRTSLIILTKKIIQFKENQAIIIHLLLQQKHQFFAKSAVVTFAYQGFKNVQNKNKRLENYFFEICDLNI